MSLRFKFKDKVRVKAIHANAKDMRSIGVTSGYLGGGIFVGQNDIDAHIHFIDYGTTWWIPLAWVESANATRCHPLTDFFKKDVICNSEQDKK